MATSFPSVGIYFHIPFCAKKCGYCDFNAYSGYKDATKAKYVDALCREIAARAEPETPVPTIFFGGGTPTLLPADELARILNAVRENFALLPDVEVSIEANPSDANPAYLLALNNAGFTRLSFGVQTFNDRLLKTIDRIHSAHEAETAVYQAKDAGFTNLSLDLMFGLPRQTLPDWERTLDSAFALDVPHLSMYGLIVEEKTRFFAMRERGKLPLPSENVELSMMAKAIERATAQGYRHYEISNYAKPGYESRHNKIYWRNEPYLGFGAGAFSYRSGVRSMNERLPGRYADTVNTSGTAKMWEECLTEREAMGETMMVGLRLTEGVNLDTFSKRFGIRAEDVFTETIENLIHRELIEHAGNHLRLTPQGLFLASDAMSAFL